MSFNSSKKNAQDLSSDVNTRRSAIRSCIQFCLFYSGSIGYNNIVEYYNKSYNLNSDSLTSETINYILSDLTDLREKSKKLNLEYYTYRKQQKLFAKRSISKEEKLIQKKLWSNINQIWEKFKN